ncbi:MAG: WD40/YVTN/BNR-like repeat-containing protein, partial [Gemmatimonadaceae bacterium]
MTKTATAAALLLLFGSHPGPTPQRGATASVPVAVYQALHWRFIGPFRAGWATVAQGVPSEPNTFYFGAAGGGVWKTTDAGRTWQGLMQQEGSSAVGALAVAPSDPNVIYVGTGQVAARYDIAAGDGVYRSADAGKTWTNVGLRATRHIGRILIDPHDPNRVLVAAMGRVYGPNPDRGVYQSTDGGQHWQQVLHVDDATGAVDLAWDPAHPAVVYAALWQMRLHPWMDYFMPQSGPGSGIYKSDDGGAHWSRLTGGLPSANIGRVGLAVAPGSGGDVVYASIALEGSALTTAEAAHDASGLYRTDNAGARWQLVNGDPALASSYFGRLTVDPNDARTVYVTGQSIRRSTNGGKTFGFFKGAPGGDDYHFLWIDPLNATHMIEGADQGAAVTVDGGESWSSWYNQPTGQLYHLAVDDRFPYRVYSGQQDNGSVELWSRGPYGAIDERDWHPVGGDERDYMVPKPGAPDTVFGTGLGGNMTRFDEVTRQSAEVSPWPVSTYGAYPPDVKYRYTWITPMAFSPLPPHTMYLGAQVLFSSNDDGDHWRVISPDLSGQKAGTTGCHDADFAKARACGFGVIFSIAPSPRSSRVIWVGTDDGLIHRTADGGAHWSNVTPPDVPPWARIDNVEASPFDANAAYASVDMHRMD